VEQILCGQYPWNHKNKSALSSFLTSPAAIFWVSARPPPSIQHSGVSFRDHIENTTFRH